MIRTNDNTSIGTNATGATAIAIPPLPGDWTESSIRDIIYSRFRAGSEHANKDADRIVNALHYIYYLRTIVAHKHTHTKTVNS